MCAVFPAALSQIMNDSMRGEPLDSNKLTLIANIIIKTNCKELIADFNKCAQRISWGKLPEAVSLGATAIPAMDVFAPYRDIITWT